jgi:hypothetical protein
MITKNILHIWVVGAFVSYGAFATEFQPRMPNSSGTTTYTEEVPGTQGMDEMQVVSTLRHDIQLLDAEIAKCERKRKGWVTATVIGGVGAVGTGIAALVQHNKIQDKKADLQKVQSDIDAKKQEVQSANTKLQQLDTQQ